MKRFTDRIVSLALLGFCLYFLYLQSASNSARTDLSQSGSGFSYQDSVRMYQALGGDSASSPPVVLFVTAWCGVCSALERELTKESVPYVKADIESDREALFFYQLVTRGTTSAIPVTTVGTDMFVGYQLSEILQAVEDLAQRNAA